MSSGPFSWCKLFLLVYSCILTLCSNSGMVHHCCTVKKQASAACLPLQVWFVSCLGRFEEESLTSLLRLWCKVLEVSSPLWPLPCLVLVLSCSYFFLTCPFSILSQSYIFLLLSYYALPFSCHAIVLSYLIPDLALLFLVLIIVASCPWSRSVYILEMP